MEALEFLKEAQRMCRRTDCHCCPVDICFLDNLGEVPEDDMKTLVSSVEVWSKKNPPKTNAQKFEEVFGFLPDGDVIFSKDYFINAVKGPVLKWDEPYEGPEHED